ncbi:MAG: hypothetical protein CVV07_08505 [Gammaproteobacteria bacterium HGW-Gammaproteobacteria-11]|nr:MAG: hypothetical protein CVV07_08505 [Gammaproteobacteria bacterium HGW-Gammaproteobacteria-11]
MQRDMDLLREILLKLEGMSQQANSILTFKAGDLGIEGFTDDQVIYHFRLLADEGYIDQGGRPPLSGLMFRQLTWKGHDFADSVRDSEIWRKARGGALAAGGWTLDLIKDLAKGYVRKKLSDTTGIEL